MKRMLAFLFSLLILLSSASRSFAFGRDDVPTQGEIIFDLAIARPVGLATLIIGTSVFISPVTILFALTSGSMKTVSTKFVKEPFEYTFLRPLGELEQE